MLPVAAILLTAGITLVAGCAESYRARLPRTRVPALEPVRTASPEDDRADASSPSAGAATSAGLADTAAAFGPGHAVPATIERNAGTRPTSSPRPNTAHGDPGFPPAATDVRPLVSLWGDELIDDDRDVALPYDGSGNIRQVSFGSEGSTFDPDVDRTGQLLVYASTRHRETADIYVQSTVGTAVTQITADAGHDIMPAFDPTGARIAFASDRSGNWDIYVVPTEGGRPVQLTSDREPELHPTWSPDGRHIAYCRFGARSGRWEIWVTDLDNPSTPSFLTFGLFPQWSPDVATSKLLFQRSRQRGSHYHSIWTIDWVDGEAQRPTEILSAGNAALINPAWAPDGRRIVFITVVEPDATPDARPIQSDVWVVDLDGTNRLNLTSGRFANYQPVWAPNGAVYFVSNRSGVDNLWAASIGDRNDPSTSGADSVANVDPSTPNPGGQP